VLGCIGCTWGHRGFVEETRKSCLVLLGVSECPALKLDPFVRLHDPPGWVRRELWREKRMEGLKAEMGVHLPAQDSKGASKFNLRHFGWRVAASLFDDRNGPENLKITIEGINLTYFTLSHDDDLRFVRDIYRFPRYHAYLATSQSG
jgi:hypothetical protein